MVSILIAARNEEANIIRCLESVARLSYPATDYEVLIGNDHSEDQTQRLVEAYISDKPNHRLLNITGNLGQAYGKANVLAQLAHEARGDYFFITDADMELPPDWIQSMLSGNQHPEMGVVSGITTVKGNTVFHHLQAIDWLYALAGVSLMAAVKIPVTALGNNMYITREAYLSTGGYENIPFSITEDYKLFMEAVKQGFEFSNLMDRNVLGQTQPVESLVSLLHQRKRWMYGAMQLPVYIVFGFLVQAFFFPIILGIFFLSPAWAGLVWIAKIVLQSLFVWWILRKLDQTHLNRYVLLYEFYTTFLSLALIVFYFLPLKVIWKGRKY